MIAAQHRNPVAKVFNNKPDMAAGIPFAVFPFVFAFPNHNITRLRRVCHELCPKVGDAAM